MSTTEIEQQKGDLSAELDLAAIEVVKVKRIFSSLGSTLGNYRRERVADAAKFEELTNVRKADAAKIEELLNERNNMVMTMGTTLKSVEESKRITEAALLDARKELLDACDEKKKGEAIILRRTKLLERRTQEVVAEKHELNKKLDQLKTERTSEMLALKNELQQLESELDVQVEDGKTHATELQTQLTSFGKVSKDLETKLKDVISTNKELRMRITPFVKENKRLKNGEETSRKMVQEEKEKGLCHICYVKPKDTILFPCLHLHFCFNCLDKHRKLSKTCPSCKACIVGVLRCDINIT